MKRVLALLLLGAAVYFALFNGEAEKAEVSEAAETTAIPVDVVLLRPGPQTDVVTSYGQVQARWQATIRSEVSGRVTAVSSTALAGSTVAAGDTLVEIEDTAQRLELATRQAELATARRALAEEKQRARIAAENWQAAGYAEPAGPLVLRQPQVAEAEVRMEAAALAVKRAEYLLQQTRIKAPFDGAVTSRSTAPGDYIQAGSEIAQMYDRRQLELVLQLSEEELARLDLQSGAAAKLASEDTNRTWQGGIARVGKQVDPLNRWVEVIVSIDNTAGLLPGQFIKAELDGRGYAGMVRVPFGLIARDGAIWTVDADDRLQRTAITPLFDHNGHSYFIPDETLGAAVRVTAPRSSFLPGIKVAPRLAAEIGPDRLAAGGANQ